MASGRRRSTITGSCRTSETRSILGLAASEGVLQLAEHIAQLGQRFAVAGPVTPALRLDGTLVQLGRPAGEIRGGPVVRTGGAEWRGGSRARPDLAAEQ